MVELKEAVWLVVHHFTWQRLTGQWRSLPGSCRLLRVASFPGATEPLPKLNVQTTTLPTEPTVRPSLRVAQPNLRGRCVDVAFGLAPLLLSNLGW